MKPSLPLVLVLGVASALLTLGCRDRDSDTPQAPKRHPVAVRAPFDLDCPREQLAYQRLDPKTMGVSGCGRRATYIRVCRDRVSKTYGNQIDTYVECTWTLDLASN
jgi:hypothetical protein